MLPPIFPRPTIPSFTSDPLHKICGRVGTNNVPVRPQISSSSWSRCRCQQLGMFDSAGADAAGFGGSQVTGGLRRLMMTAADRSEEHTYELQSIMRTSYVVFRFLKYTSLI